MFIKSILYFFYKQSLNSDDNFVNAQNALLSNRMSKIANLLNFFTISIGKIPEQKQKEIDQEFRVLDDEIRTIDEQIRMLTQQKSNRQIEQFRLQGKHKLLKELLSEEKEEIV